MRNKIYKEGLLISRNFDKRGKTDTEKLYAIIQRAVSVVVEDTDKKEVEDALDFLVILYEPLIKKTAAKFYCALSRNSDFEDVLQEAYTIFIDLLRKYNSAEASFSYYIGLMLKQRMRRWAEKENNYNHTHIIANLSDPISPHPKFDSATSVEDYFNGCIFIQEYEEFITDRSFRQSRSKTVKEVCDRFFLGSASCSKIAQDLGISYHAVYEIIGKIKNELKDFMLNNPFSNYYITSTGKCIVKEEE